MLYHNDGLGNVRTCTNKDCNEPFHSADPAECRKRYETLMASFTIPTPWTKTRRPRR